MISVDQAIEIARSNFPDGLEKLTEHPGITIREAPMDGCDGWCLSTGDKAIIHLNSELSAGRKRFTLAHELGHIILGVPAIIGETYEDMLKSDSEDEHRVDELASELLLPAEVVKRSLPDLPVVAADLKKLAKKAKVSELATAVRVCNLSNEIGLINASVILFNGNEVNWQWSKTLKMSDNTAVSLLAEARKISPNAFRYSNSQSDNAIVIVASIIENPLFGTSTLFVQKLPVEIGMNLSRPEKRTQLEQSLFSDNSQIRHKINGLLGAHKKRITEDGMTQDEAETDFWSRNKEKLMETRVNSEQGRDYVRLRIGEWY